MIVAIKTKRDLIDTIKYYEKAGTQHGQIYYEAHRERLKITETYEELIKPPKKKKKN